MNPCTSSPNPPERKRLHHEVPHWVEDGALYFITLNCAKRGQVQLTRPGTAAGLLEPARFYHDQQKWHVTLLLPMPDHLHALMSFPRDVSMSDVFKPWKRFTARQFGIEWQDGFLTIGCATLPRSMPSMNGT